MKFVEKIFIWWACSNVIKFVTAQPDAATLVLIPALLVSSMILCFCLVVWCSWYQKWTQINAQAEEAKAAALAGGGSGVAGRSYQSAYQSAYVAQPQQGNHRAPDPRSVAQSGVGTTAVSEATYPVAAVIEPSTFTSNNVNQDFSYNSPNYVTKY